MGVSTFPAVSPPSGARIAGDRVELVWRSVEPDALYELTLTDARGDAVWATAVRDTSVVVPASVGLGSGSPHYWYVDALLERGRSARTDVMEFTVVR